MQPALLLRPLRLLPLPLLPHLSWRDSLLLMTLKSAPRPAANAAKPNAAAA